MANAPNYQHVKRLRPAHILMIRLARDGNTNVEIAAQTGYSVQQVSNVLNSPEVQAVLQQLQESMLDSMAEVAQEIQLAAPLAIKRKVDLLFSGDDRVASGAATDLLHMAGHAPVKRVQVTGATAVEKKYEGLSDADMKRKLLEELEGDLGDQRVLN